MPSRSGSGGPSSRATLTRGTTSISSLDGVTFLGSAENEYLDDPDNFRALLGLNFDLLGEFPFGEGELDARTEGFVGWAVVRSSLASPEGPREMRATLPSSTSSRTSGASSTTTTRWPCRSRRPSSWRLGDEPVADLVEAERPDPGRTFAATDGTVTIGSRADCRQIHTELTATFGDRAWLTPPCAHGERSRRPRPRPTAWS